MARSFGGPIGGWLAGSIGWRWYADRKFSPIQVQLSSSADADFQGASSFNAR
jgi:hypothetical protein